MNEETAKKLLQLIVDYNRPYPQTETGACVGCGEQTRDWKTDYPKGHNIIWKCQFCRDRENVECDRRMREWAKKDPDSWIGELYSEFKKEDEKE